MILSIQASVELETATTKEVSRGISKAKMAKEIENGTEFEDERSTGKSRDWRHC